MRVIWYTRDKNNGRDPVIFKTNNEVYIKKVSFVEYFGPRTDPVPKHKPEPNQTQNPW